MKLRWVILLALALVAALLFSSRHDDQEIEGEDVPAAIQTASPASITEPAAPSDVASIVEPKLGTERSPAALFAPLPPAGESEHAGIRLYGFVRAGNGDEHLVPAVNITITDRLGEVQNTTVDATCAYSFTALSPGRHWIVCGAGEWGKVQRTIELDALQKDRRFDLQLQFGVDLRVEVVDRAGNAVPDLPLIAVATIEAPDEWLDEVSDRMERTIGVGAWNSERRFAEGDRTEIIGRIKLRIPPPLFVSLMHQQRVVATKRVEAGETSVRFVLDPDDPLLQRSSIRLRLIDAQSRQPLPEARVHIGGSIAGYSGTTTLDGSFRGNAWPGWVSVRVEHKDYERSEFVARAEAGVESDFGDIALESAVSISGHVVDERRRDASGSLTVSPTESPVSFSSSFTTEAVIARGAFRIAGLSRCRYRLTFQDAVDPSISQTFVVDLRPGSLEDVRLQLVRGTPLIVSASDDRWPLVYFDVLDGEGVKHLSSRLLDPNPRKITLAPGRYEVEVRIGQSIQYPRRSIVIAYDPVELSLP